MINNPRIICIGSNIESLIVLQGLVEAGTNLVALVTLPAGSSGAACDYYDLHRFCEEYNIATIDATNINCPQVIQALIQLDPDYIYTLGWSQLFDAPLLRVPRKYVVGSHPSPLPEGRGRAPIPWAILESRANMAVSLFRMDLGIDAGPLLYQKHFNISPKANAMEVYQVVAENLQDAFVALNQQHRSNESIAPIIQNESLATYRAKRMPADGHIDFHQPAEAIDRLIRAVSHPYPGAYCYYDDSRISVWRSSTENLPRYQGVPGQILKKKDDAILVQAVDSPIWISEVTDFCGKQLELGPFRVGKRFGYSFDDEIYSLRNEVRKLQGIVESLRETAPRTSAA